MKLTVLQENLEQGLSIVNNFVSSGNQLPVLANILLSAEKGKLKLSATNLETGINLWLPAKIEKKGKITIPAKVFYSFVSSLPADKAVLQAKQNKLKINCRNFKASFNGLSASEFPSIPSLKNKKESTKAKKLVLKTDKFVKAVKEVAFTSAIDEARPILTGVRLNFLKKKLQLVATDGYRLSIKKINLDKKEDLPTIIISAQALMEIAKIASQQEEKKVRVILTKDSNQAIFSFESVEVVTRLIEGEFPDFKKIIPEDCSTKIVVDKTEFEQAVKSASLFAKDSANIIKFKINNSKLIIAANSPDIGDNKVELEIEKKGENNQIAFNFRFLQDYLNVVEKEKIILEISGPLKPGVFKTAKKSSFLHIIMPVRIQE